MQKKILFILIALTLSNSNFGQIIEGFPINDKGFIVFSDLVKVDSLNKKMLYSNAKQFFINTFESANNVIQLDDNENAILIGKGYNEIGIETEVSKKIITLYTVQLWYSIKIQCKDNRYKYEIYDLYFKTSENTNSAEDFFSVERYQQINNNNKLTKKQLNMTKEFLDQYKNKTLLTINSLIKTLSLTMSKKENEDW